MPSRTNRKRRRREEDLYSAPKRIKSQSDKKSIPPSTSTSQSALNTTEMRKVKVEDRIFTIRISEWAKRSPYFENLLGRDFAEGGHETIALDGSIEAFGIYAKCVAGIRPDPSKSDLSTMLEVFRMADYFGDVATRDAMLNVMHHWSTVYYGIDHENVLEVMETAWRFNLIPFFSDCLMVIIAESHRILEHEDFVRMSAESAKVVLSLSTLNLSETKVLEAITRWDAICPNREGREKVLGQLRLHRFSRRELRELVMPLGLMDESDVKRHLYGDIPGGTGRGKVSRSFVLSPRGMEFLAFYDIPSQVPEALRNLTTEVCASSSAYSTMMVYHVDLEEYNKFNEIVLIMDDVNKSIQFRIHTGDAEIAPEDFKDIVWLARQPLHGTSNISQFTWSFSPRFFRYLRICAFSQMPLNFSGNLWVKHQIRGESTRSIVKEEITLLNRRLRYRAELKRRGDYHLINPLF